MPTLTCAQQPAIPPPLPTTRGGEQEKEEKEEGQEEEADEARRRRGRRKRREEDDDDEEGRRHPHDAEALGGADEAHDLRRADDGEERTARRQTNFFSAGRTGAAGSRGPGQVGSKAKQGASRRRTTEQPQKETHEDRQTDIPLLAYKTPIIV